MNKRTMYKAQIPNGIHILIRSNRNVISLQLQLEFLFVPTETSLGRLDSG